MEQTYFFHKNWKYRFRTVNHSKNFFCPQAGISYKHFCKTHLNPLTQFVNENIPTASNTDTAS